MSRFRWPTRAAGWRRSFCSGSSTSAPWPVTGPATAWGEPVDLTATEQALLRVLALDAGRVVPYDTLLRRVWSGRDRGGANLTRVVVRSLRRKLGDHADNPTWIFNQRGVGYRMAGLGGGMKDAGGASSTNFALKSLLDHLKPCRSDEPSSIVAPVPSGSPVRVWNPVPFPRSALTSPRGRDTLEIRDLLTH